MTFPQIPVEKKTRGLTRLFRRCLPTHRAGTDRQAQLAAARCRAGLDFCAPRYFTHVHARRPFRNCLVAALQSKRNVTLRNVTVHNSVTTRCNVQLVRVVTTGVCRDSCAPGAMSEHAEQLALLLLPSDLINLVLLRLNPRAVYQLRRVCRSFRAVTADEQLWRQAFHIRGGRDGDIETLLLCGYGDVRHDYYDGPLKRRRAPDDPSIDDIDDLPPKTEVELEWESTYACGVLAIEALHRSLVGRRDDLASRIAATEARVQSFSGYE